MKPILIIVPLAVIAIGAVLYFYPGTLSTVPGVGSGNEAPAGGSGFAGNDGVASVDDETGIIQGKVRYVGEMPDFTSVMVAVYNPETEAEVERVALLSDGSYKFVLSAGEYVLDIADGTGVSKHLPQRMYVGAGETLSLNFRLDQ